MYTVPKEAINLEEEVIPTPSNQAIEKTIAEININKIIQDYHNTYFRGIFKKISLIFNYKLRKQRAIHLSQLKFLEKVISLNSSLNTIDKAYLILGTFRYVQGRWGTFPTSGPLYEMALKSDDLIQVISENDQSIKLEKLFNNPELINNKADEVFAKFLDSNPKYLI